MDRADAAGPELGRRARAPRAPHARPSRSRSSATTSSPTARWPTWAAALAGGLHERGVGAGDVVGLLSYNCIEFLATIFAANHLGAIAMPINWRLAAPELRYILEHSEARALVCDEALVDLANDATDGHRGDARPRRASRRPAPDGWAALRRSARRRRAPPARVPRRGRRHPPADVHVGHDRAAEGRDAHPRQPGVEELRAHHRVRLHRAPTSGSRAGRCTTSARSTSSTTTMIAVGRDDHHPPRVRRRRASSTRSSGRGSRTVWLAPAMVNAILALPDIEQRDLSSVRVIIDGGEKMPIPLIERIQRDVPVGVVRRRLRPHRDGLGRHVPRPRQHRHQARQRRPAVPLPRARHLGRATARRCPPGERGEVVLRGPKVFKGYWRDPDATAAAFAGGWFHTGDIGVRDDDGYLYIVDRLKDMIVSGGENIASSEVERVLYEHDVGASRPRSSAAPTSAGARSRSRSSCCAPDATATPDELIEHCRGQLAQVQGPEGRHVRRRAARGTRRARSSSASCAPLSGPVPGERRCDEWCVARTTTSDGVAVRASVVA